MESEACTHFGEPGSALLARAARTIHRGPYERIAPAYESPLAWIDANDSVPSGPSREVYPRYSDVAELHPEVYLTRDPDEYVTEVQIPLDIRGAPPRSRNHHFHGGNHALRP